MGANDNHEVGVLLTPDIVGKKLYSHQAACKGRLVSLFVDEVGYTHTKYHTEDGENGDFCTGNCGKGGKNWEAINLDTAKQEIKQYWLKAIADKQQELSELIDDQEAVDAEIGVAEREVAIE